MAKLILKNDWSGILPKVIRSSELPFVLPHGVLILFFVYNKDNFTRSKFFFFFYTFIFIIIMSEKLEQDKVSHHTYDDPEYQDDVVHGPEPTEQDRLELREVPDKIPATAYLVIIIEFCERFTYYGLSGPFQNYIQHPAPPSCMFIYTIYFFSNSFINS